MTAAALASSEFYRTESIDNVEDAIDLVSKLDPEYNKRLAQRLFPKLAKGVETASVIQKNFTLHAMMFLHSPYPFHWLCGGVGTGKSAIIAEYALDRILTNPETVGCIAANTHQQLSQSTLPHFLKLLQAAGLKFEIGKRPPRKWGKIERKFPDYDGVICVLVRPGVVAYVLTRSLENYKAIRGINIGWVCLDEVCDTREEAYTDIVERLRCPHSHALQVRIVGMPDMPGNNWTWKEFTEAPEGVEKDLSEYKVTFLSTTEVSHLPVNFVRRLLGRLDPLRALQRVYARIVIDNTGRVYYCYSEDTHVKNVEYNPDLDLFLCFDFNILSTSPITAVVCQEVWDYEKQKWVVHAIDEIVIAGATTVEACLEFLRRYGHHRQKVWVFGDASGNLNRTVTEYEHIETLMRPAFGQHLYVDHERKSNPPIIFRVAAFNGMLRNSLREVLMYIHPRCKHLRLDLQELKPKEGKIDKSDPERSHASDGVGYYLALRHSTISLNNENTSVLAAY